MCVYMQKILRFIHIIPVRMIIFTFLFIEQTMASATSDIMVEKYVILKNMLKAPAYKPDGLFTIPEKSVIPFQYSDIICVQIK